MKVGLADIDSKIPNLALMRLSAYHKARGDEVKFYDPLFDKPDVVYASKMFDFTADQEDLPPNTIKGGPGYTLNACLPAKFDSIYPDYELYDCDYAIGYTSRGCPRKCPWCVVPEIEGGFRQVGNIHKFWKGQGRLKLLDDNLTADEDYCVFVLRDMATWKMEVDFSQGLDIRLMTPKIASALNKVRLWGEIHFAWDSIGYEGAVKEGIEILEAGGVSRHKLMFYVLIGYNTTPEQDLYRVEKLRGWEVEPFVMPYDKHNRYQWSFARWCNRKKLFHSVAWEDYRTSKRGDLAFNDPQQTRLQ